MKLYRFVLAASTALAIASVSPAKSADQLDAATALSAHQSYAEQVAAECMRNHAYGLSTNGLPLKAFCDMQGNTAAMQAQYQSSLVTTAKRSKTTNKGILPSR